MPGKCLQKTEFSRWHNSLCVLKIFRQHEIFTSTGKFGHTEEEVETL